MKTLSFGQRLKLLRKERGLTLKDVARLSGLSISYISDLERGRATPSFSALGMLASAFGMTPSDLLREEDWDVPARLDEHQGVAPIAARISFAGALSLLKVADAYPESREESSLENHEARVAESRAEVSGETGGRERSQHLVERQRSGSMDRWQANHIYSTPSLPPGLLALLDDPQHGPHLKPEWLGLLASLSRHAVAISGKPLSKEDFLEIFLHLRRIIGPVP